jgi:hypothetical protein
MLVEPAAELLGVPSAGIPHGYMCTEARAFCPSGVAGVG